MKRVPIARILILLYISAIFADVPPVPRGCGNNAEAATQPISLPQPGDGVAAALPAARTSTAAE